MFTTADNVLNRLKIMEFTTYDGPDNIKTILLRELIKIKLTTVKNRFGKFLQKDGLDKVDPNKLKFMISLMLSFLVNEYNDKADIIFIKKFKISKKDSKYLIDSYESFRVYIVDAITDELNSIVMDDNYSTNFERLNTILYTVSISLTIIPRDVVGTFN